LTGEPRSATVVADDETEVLQIRKAAIKPIFENNPKLLDIVSEIIDDRRGRLDPQTDEPNKDKAHHDKGVMRSLKKFFGIE
jgi:CRP-like cAMP-binding protein